MAEHYYTVGKHGPPTKETAPHGFMYVPGNDWNEGVRHGATHVQLRDEATVWWPLPAPPTEQAPPPEPVARWTARNLGCGWSSLRCGPDLNHPSHEDATAAADALNTLDATGIVWGEPRPMSELPKAGRVLARHQNGGVYEREAKFLRLHGGPHWTGWYGPLPEVTP